ncbi:MAG TPA: hypothetical protein VJT67_12150 [Longimicrobiaceae bacterium]|nr:hypothetical protein [Longimicrobiaceae bacterium]
MDTIEISDAQTRLPELVEAAAGGRVVVIEATDGTAVRLVPVQPHAKPRFGSARGMFTMRDDFDAPLEDFLPYER